MSLTLRKAHIRDLEMLQEWDQQPHVKASNPNDEWEWDLQNDFPWRQQLIAEWNNRPVGFIQIIDPAREITQYWGEIGHGKRAIDVWIGPPDALGKGYGTLMMKDAFERCFADDQVSEILIDPLVSNKGAIRFYQRLGFKFVENRFFDMDYCAVHRLTRETWDTLHRNT